MYTIRRCRVTTTIMSMMLIAVFSSVALADGGRDCDSKRALNGADKASINNVIRIIKNSVPAAPKGWKFMMASDAAKLPDQIAGIPGCPVMYEFDCAYFSQKNAMEMAGKMNTQRLSQIAAEMAAAAQRGDTKRAEELQKEMENLQKGATPAEGASVGIKFTCNGAMSASSGVDCKQISIPGAKYAVFCESASEKRIIIYLGRWTSTGGSIGATYDEKIPGNTTPQIIQIDIFGQSERMVQEMAKKINLRPLNAVLK